MLPAEDDLRRLVRTLQSLEIRDFALTGGVAFGVWVEPRETRDLDVCGVLPPEAVEPLLALHDGMRVGASEIPDIVRFRVGEWDVDLFVAKTQEDRDCIARAPAVDIGGVVVRVVSPEDLVLHKMKKLRSDRRRILQDVADLRALFKCKPALDWAFMSARLPAADLDLLQSIRDLSDDELLERLAR